VSRTGDTFIIGEVLQRTEWKVAATCTVTCLGVTDKPVGVMSDFPAMVE
jgi:hypothetical protein